MKTFLRCSGQLAPEKKVIKAGTVAPNYHDNHNAVFYVRLGNLVINSHRRRLLIKRIKYNLFVRLIARKTKNFDSTPIDQSGTESKDKQSIIVSDAKSGFYSVPRYLTQSLYLQYLHLVMKNTLVPIPSLSFIHILDTKTFLCCVNFSRFLGWIDDWAGAGGVYSKRRMNIDYKLGKALAAGKNYFLFSDT